jgi:hypothetical protein
VKLPPRSGLGNDGVLAETLWLTAAHRRPAAAGLCKAVWLPFTWIAGCPNGQSRTNVPAAGGAGVRIR